MALVIAPQIEAKIGADDHGNVTAKDVQECFQNHCGGYCEEQRPEHQNSDGIPNQKEPTTEVIDMATSKKTTGQQPWEVLDADMTDDNVGCVSQEEEKAVDEALGLQMISIRLERSLIANLKEVAEHHKIGYQPLIRDLLNRFAKSEMRNILQERLASIQRDIGSQAPLEAVDEFLEREHKRA